MSDSSETSKEQAKKILKDFSSYCVPYCNDELAEAIARGLDESFLEGIAAGESGPFFENVMKLARDKQ